MTATRRCSHPECAFADKGGAPLAQDNAGPYCGPCVQRESERRFPVGAPRSKPRPARKPQKEEVAIRMNGVKMTPTTLPRRRSGRRGRDWPGMVRRFARSGEECVLVEVEGLKLAHTLFTELQRAIALERERDPKSVLAYPAVREGKCYLVRVTRPNSSKAAS